MQHSIAKLGNAAGTLGLAAMLFVSAPARATETVITFDDAPQYTCGAQVTSGLVFTSGYCLGVWPNNPVSTNGTPALIYGFGAMDVSQFDGGSFHLTSFEAGISWYSVATSATINYTFDLAAGGTSTGSFVIGQGLQTYTFNADIVHANFSGLADGYVAIDNVTGDFVPAPVPEPASAALIAVGLGALAVWGRRRRGSDERKAP